MFTDNITIAFYEKKRKSKNEDSQVIMEMKKR